MTKLHKPCTMDKETQTEESGRLLGKWTEVVKGINVKIIIKNGEDPSMLDL